MPADEETRLFQDVPSTNASDPVYHTPTPQRLTLVLLISVSIICLGSFQYGYNLSVTNTPQVSIGNRGHPEVCESRSFFKPCVPMDSTAYSVFASIFLLGALFGALTGGVSSERIGRKMTLIISDCFFIVGAIILSVLSNYWFFLVGRFIIGIGVGLSSVVVPAYLSEIAVSKYRGCIGSFHQLVLVSAIASANILAIPFNFRPGWRFLMAVPGIIGLIQLCLVFWIPESPRWLISRGWKGLAEKNLQTYRATSDVKEEFETLNKKKEEKSFFQIIRSVFRLTLLRPFLIGVFLHMSQQFSGVNVIIFYSTKVFNDAGINNAALASGVVGIDFVVSTFIALVLIERLGRKVLFMSSLIICAFSYTGVAVTNILKANGVGGIEMNYISLVFILIYIFGYSIGLGPIPWIMLSEIYPADLKGFFYGVTTAINWTCKLIVTLSFPTVTRVLHIYTFVPYAIYLYLAIIIAIFLVQETKGKSIEELTGKL